MINFVIKKDSGRGYVVVRKDYPWEFHAHLSTMNGCRQLLYYIHKGLLPKSSYLQGSSRRLLTSAEYDGLKRPKQKYYNKSGCNKR